MIVDLQPWKWSVHWERPAGSDPFAPEPENLRPLGYAVIRVEALINGMSHGVEDVIKQMVPRPHRCLTGKPYAMTHECAVELLAPLGDDWHMSVVGLTAAFSVQYTRALHAEMAKARPGLIVDQHVPVAEVDVR